MTAKILTANRLDDGRVVWFSTDNLWDSNPNKALLAQTPQDIDLLEKALAVSLSNNLVVDANLIDISDDTSDHQPVRLRERIRKNGPTIAYGATPTLPHETAPDSLR